MVMVPYPINVHSNRQNIIWGIILTQTILSERCYDVKK